ncbi:MAG: ferredoxin [Eubacterium sp.]|nr:ferredoxin [Eubacterium sp.]
MFLVKVHSNNKIAQLQMYESQSLLHQLRENGFVVNSPCNGNGTCGKCRVKILSPGVAAASENDIKLLGKAAVDRGYRLACRLFIESDLEISLDDDDLPAKILTEGIQRNVDVNPLVSKSIIKLDKPDLADQNSDLGRLYATVPLEASPDLALMRSLPALLRKAEYNVTLIKDVSMQSADKSRLLGVESGDTTGALYGAAVDIGTTTIASYLLDLGTGKRLFVNSLLNPQKIYGADVISRIKHTMDSAEGLEQLHTQIVNAINASISVMCIQAQISPDNIYALTLVGNTTMLHLLLKVEPRYIASAPFTPAFTSTVRLKAEELGISINPNGLVCVLPSVSAYIGADTAGAVLSTGMHTQADTSLLIDIGTNGEIVLGNRDRLYACSSAAGPAFEGANIRNGMGSIAGAISTVSLKQGLSYTTIGDSRPIGICGTGVVDALAQLLEVGIVDETGRIDTGWEAPNTELAALTERISQADGMNAFIICYKEETPTWREIAITQKDIRELQNAKAAIAAGINVLVREAGISFDDIKTVYLAGGFGSYINIESALKIGLIPSALEGKIQTAGNAAGQGAIEALINSDSLKAAEEISRKIKYIELSASKDFNDYYVECMMFEE